MRALVLESHGGLENLKVVNDHKIPAVVEGQVLIRVRASSFNYHDVFTVRGMPGIKVPLPVVIGLDKAGEICRPGRRHVRQRRGEHFSGRGRTHAGDPPRRDPG
jgi:alcohol dehydrogenase